METAIAGLRIVLLGIAGRMPFAGVAWQVLQYLEAFRRLGHEVYYLEDTGDWPYDPEANAVSADCGYTLRWLETLMSRISLGGCWAYRAASQGDRTLGPMSEQQVRRVLETCDVLVNLTGGTVLREEHLRVPIRLYLETDPVLPQIEVAEGRPFTIQLLEAHTHHFTYGENLGAPDCGVPAVRFTWQPTRQPIVLDWWDTSRLSAAAARDGRFTTVANWQQSGKDARLNGELYTWSKHHEFLKFLDLPRRSPAPLELALARVDSEALQMLAQHGWRTRDALALSLDVATYREYIVTSRGEFTVAKDQNVRLNTGWFSDRSACYLAAGKPVISQATGFDRILPTGAGLFAFTTADEAVAAIESIERDYTKHARAARALAEEFFDAKAVAGRLLAAAGVA